MKKFNHAKKFIKVLTLSSSFVLIHAALADEVSPGTVLSASNIDALKDKTLDGHKIGDMLVDTQETLIRNYGWTMKLDKTKPITPRPNIDKVTAEYAPKVTYDPKTRLISGFEAGMPFMEIRQDDPDGAIKLAYNFMRGPWHGDIEDLNPQHLIAIGAKSGIERIMRFHWSRLLVVGRLDKPYVLGDGKVAKYEAGIFTYPNDIRGIGTLTVQYMDGRLPDVYAYIKAVRRVRRLSSGSWADPLSGTDVLTDETFGMNADPTWYRDWKIKSKKWILAVAHSKLIPYQESGSSNKEKYPNLQSDKPPHWNVNDVWEPREVWEVETTPPSSHMVSRKLQYYDTFLYAPNIYWQNYYDRAGKIWRIENCNYGEMMDEQKRPIPGMKWVIVVDFQREHATVVYADPNWKKNMPNYNVSDYQPDALPRMMQ